eukprot:12251597-Alexandrium_andersonii.AAC.1
MSISKISKLLLRLGSTVTLARSSRWSRRCFCCICSCRSVASGVAMNPMGIAPACRGRLAAQQG